MLTCDHSIIEGMAEDISFKTFVVLGTISRSVLYEGDGPRQRSFQIAIFIYADL
jgi:hypothetical protein